MKIFFELFKNFKIIFRNISSLLLLILGPLTLIFLIGFAYSGDGIHSIRIGIISNDLETLKPAISNFSSFAKITEYNDVSDCMKELVLQKMHVCLEFSSNFRQNEDFPTGTIVFYYDNSRKALSQKLVDELSGFFGMQAEKISIDTAQGIFENIQNMVVYLHSRSQDIDVLVMESSNIRTNLLDRRERLIELRKEFIPIHDRMIKIQARLNKTDRNFTESYEDYHNSTYELLDELKALKNSLLFYEFNKSITFNDSIKFQNISYELNETTISVPLLNLSLKNSPLIFAIDTVEHDILALMNQTDSYYDDIRQQKQEFDAAVALVNSIKLMIDADIESSYLYAEKLRIGNEKMVEAQMELNKSISDLKRLDPNQAEKLIKPILENYEPLIPDLKNIKIAFPGMLAIIIIFISILFANILTLSEINSKAFYRNILAPVKKMLFANGLILSNLIVVFFQIFVLLIVAQFSLKIELLHMLPQILLIVFMLALVFTEIGMIVAIYLRNEQSSILTTTFMALSFFLFSDAITPLETMPKAAYTIASYNPFVIASGALRKIIIFESSKLDFEIIVLFSYLVIFSTVLYFSSKKM